VKQSNDLEICPRSLTVVSPESCRVAMYVKCSEDSEGMKRKSPFSTTPLSFDAPSLGELPRTLYCQKLRSLGYICVADIIWVALLIFEQSCPKAGDATPLVAEPETDFNAKWPFKVIYLGIIVEPLMGYIAQCNKCGLRYEDSENIASERSENRHVRAPHFHLTPPLQRIPANICIKLILLETRIPGQGRI